MPAKARCVASASACCWPGRMRCPWPRPDRSASHEPHPAMSDNAHGSGRIRLPLLDRLLDADPAAPVDPPVTVQYAVELLRQAVRRDLETLLNARRRRVPLPAGLAALP